MTYEDDASMKIESNLIEKEFSFNENVTVINPEATSNYLAVDEGDVDHEMLSDGILFEFVCIDFFA